MRKLIIFPLITIMTFSLFGCTANVTSSVESTAPSIAGSEEETTTEKSTAEESATQEPTTEEPTTEEPTTEVLFDDGKMSEYVAAAQKVFDTYKEEYESFYGIPLNTYTAFAFCDFDLDTVPELYIMTRDVYSNFNGSVYKYINNEYVFTKNLQGYENIQSYSNSEGNTLLLCTSFSYTSYDHIGNHTFSTDVDCNYYSYIDININGIDYYVGHVYTPRESNKTDFPRYYNDTDMLISENEFNNNLNEIVKSYIKNDLKYSEPEYIQSGDDQTESLSKAYSNYLKAISK